MTEKSGILVRVDAGSEGLVSGTPNDMISTILETSLAILSGSTFGNVFPSSRKLHKYIARANSGNSSWPDFVVSARFLNRFLELFQLKYRELLTKFHQDL